MVLAPPDQAGSLAGTFQMFLDIAGVLPVVGTAADLTSLMIAAYHGDWLGVTTSLMGLVPIAGDIAAATAKAGIVTAGVGTVAFKADDVAEVLGKLKRIVGNRSPAGIVSPSNTLQRGAKQGGYIDPRTNRWIRFEGTLAADHVYPQSLIKRLAGFDTLTREQQDFLLNYPGNFEPFPTTWNSSKKHLLADQWATTPMGRQASKEYIDSLRERQQAFEGFAKNLIDFWTR
jgi:hypothetical protein